MSATFTFPLTPFASEGGNLPATGFCRAFV